MGFVEYSHLIGNKIDIYNIVSKYDMEKGMVQMYGFSCIRPAPLSI